MPGVTRPQFPPWAGIPFVCARHRLMYFPGLHILAPSARKFFWNLQWWLFHPNWIHVGCSQKKICVSSMQGTNSSPLCPPQGLCARQAPCWARGLRRAGYLIGESDEYSGAFSIWCNEDGADRHTECGETSRKWGASPQTETHAPQRKCQHISQQDAFKNVRGVDCWDHWLF